MDAHQVQEPLYLLDRPPRRIPRRRSPHPDELQQIAKLFALDSEGMHLLRRRAPVDGPAPAKHSFQPSFHRRARRSGDQEPAEATGGRLRRPPLRETLQTLPHPVEPATAQSGDQASPTALRHSIEVDPIRSQSASLAGRDRLEVAVQRFVIDIEVTDRTQRPAGPTKFGVQTPYPARRQDWLEGLQSSPDAPHGDAHLVHSFRVQTLPGAMLLAPQNPCLPAEVRKGQVNPSIRGPQWRRMGSVGRVRDTNRLKTPLELTAASRQQLDLPG